MPHINILTYLITEIINYWEAIKVMVPIQVFFNSNFFFKFQFYH